MRPNHLIAIIGVVMIVGALAASTVVSVPEEGAEAPKSVFSVSFPMSNASAAGSGTTSMGSSAEAELVVARQNVTSVAVTVTWTDSKPVLAQAAAVTAVLSDPSGKVVGTGTGQGSGQSIVITVALNPVPEGRNLSAHDLAGAESEASAENPAQTNGTGGWTLSVSAERSGVIGSFLRSGSVDWSAAMEYTYYTARVSEAPQ